MGWLAHVLGLDNGSGRPYLWWSGAGSDLGEVAILGGLAAGYKRHACHVDRCWRFGIHPVAGTPFKACRKHHPAVPNKVTAAHVAEAHEQARAQS